jgi:hypothetical protein
MRKSLQLCCGLIFLCLSACLPLAAKGPEMAAQTAFEDWARQAGVPYKNVSCHVTRNDDAFATVQIRATLKESALEDWLDKQAEIECRHVGAEWQCNSAIAFSLTQAAQDKQNQAATGTAAASTIKLQATATEQARQLEATRVALAATQVVVNQNANATATAAALAATATALVSPPPMLFEIFANQGWQDTLVYIQSSQSFQIKYTSGRIADLNTIIKDGNGSDYVCGHASCCEPLPNARRSSIISKVGKQIFFVGNGGTFTVDTSGNLLLRINDCDAGLYDNSGSLKVHIIP